MSGRISGAGGRTGNTAGEASGWGGFSALAAAAACGTAPFFRLSLFFGTLLLLKQLNLALEAYGREQLKWLELSPSQVMALHYLLSRKGHSVCATELHEMFGVSKPAISAILKGLRQKGYLELQLSPQDDRKKQIVLTQKAYQMEPQIAASLAQQQERVCRRVPEQQRKALESGLLIMIENLKETQGGNRHAENTVGTGRAV